MLLSHQARTLLRLRPPVRRDTPRSQCKARLNLESLEARLAPAATYYVSPSGDDARDGRSPATAWRTINRVNTYSPRVGDEILFEGGYTYTGSLLIYAIGPGDPITLATYGNGRATINSGTNAAIGARVLGGIHVRDLNLRGAGAETNQSPGIQVDNASGVASTGSVVLDNMEVTGYGLAGIVIYAAASGYDSVSITNVDAHHNANGVLIGNGDPNLRVVRNLYIGNTQAHDNNSWTSPLAGIGMLLMNINGGVLERSLLYNNGSESGGGGHAGLLVNDSSYLTVQYNEAWGNVDYNYGDGQGFVFTGSDYILVQYNYSHNNGNGGFQVTDQNAGFVNHHVTFRYNISENDAVGIIIAGHSSTIDVYNNTVYTNNYPQVALVIMDWTGGEVYFRNNIVVSLGGSVTLIIDDTTLYRGNVPVFQNNLYWIDEPYFELSAIYGSSGYFTLAEWQNATGQEMLDGQRVGFVGDPRLANPGGGGIVGDPYRFDLLWAYYLLPDSPLRATGVDLGGRFGVDPGTRDFYGTQLPRGGGFSVGAYQAPAGTTPEDPPLDPPPGIDLDDIVSFDPVLLDPPPSGDLVVPPDAELEDAVPPQPGSGGDDWFAIVDPSEPEVVVPSDDLSGQLPLDSDGLADLVGVTLPGTQKPSKFGRMRWF